MTANSYAAHQPTITMKIVVLDAATLKPQDLNWSPLQALGDCAIYERTSAGEILSRAHDATAVLTNKFVMSREILHTLSKLVYVGVTATGTNVVDLPAARERKITVTNVPAYGTASVAQATLGLLLNLAHHIGYHAETVRAGRWARAADWCYWDKPLVELAGLTLGVVGFGEIGREVARLASAFGMRVLVATRSQKSFPDYVTPTTLEELLAASDAVSLHCPLTDQTEQLINAQRLALMKPTAFLINTSRGALVDETALAAALNAGRLAGAGLDVLSREPPSPDNPLLTAKNCVITPHLAWGTLAARERLLNVAVENLAAFRSGKPMNVVS